MGYQSDEIAGKNPPVRLMRGQEVSLGCGTLILIALIVMIFGSRNTGELEKRIDAVSSQVAELKSTIEAQSAEIRQLRTPTPPDARAADPGGE